MSYLFARYLMLGLSAAAVLFCVTLAVVITSSITRPINRAVAIAQTVAAGDLTSRIEVHGKDETSMLLTALKTMNDSLALIVGQVRAGTDTMSTASQEIAAASREQSLGIEQVNQAIMQMDSVTQQNAALVEESAAAAESLQDQAAPNWRKSSGCSC